MESVSHARGKERGLHEVSRHRSVCVCVRSGTMEILEG